MLNDYWDKWQIKPKPPRGEGGMIFFYIWNFCNDHIKLKMFLVRV